MNGVLVYIRSLMRANGIYFPPSLEAEMTVEVLRSLTEDDLNVLEAMLNGQPLPEPSAQAEAKSPPPAFSAFEIGRVYVTPGALALGPEVYLDALECYQRCDWSEMTAEDAYLNRKAVERGGSRIFSAYQYGQQRVWVITEADRSSTTILLPEEY